MVRLRAVGLWLAVLGLPTVIGPWGAGGAASLAAAEPKGGAASKISPLDNVATVKWTNLSLEDVVTDLRKTHKVETSVDRQSIENEGLVTTNIKITMDFRGLTLRSVLWLALDAYRLELVEGPDGLLITSRPVAEAMYLDREYDLKPLGTLGRDSKAVLDLVRGSIPAYWKESDNFGGAIAIEDGKLKVNQTPIIHEQIELLLRDIQRALAVGKRPVLSPLEQNEQAIADRLAKPPLKKITVDGEIALADLAGQCGQAFSIPVWVEGAGLDEVRVGYRQMINPMIEGKTGQEILTSILKPLELATVIRHEVLMVTSEKRAHAPTEIGVFHSRAKGAKIKGTTEEIVRKIQDSDEYGTWGDGGGVIQSFGPLIVVRQSPQAIQALEILFGGK